MNRQYSFFANRPSLLCIAISEFLMGFSFIMYYFYNERLDERDSHRHVCFCLLSESKPFKFVP